MFYKYGQYVMLVVLSFCTCLLGGCGGGIQHVADAASAATGTPVQEVASSSGQTAAVSMPGKTATAGQDRNRREYGGRGYPDSKQWRCSN